MSVEAKLFAFQALCDRVFAPKMLARMDAAHASAWAVRAAQKGRWEPMRAWIAKPGAALEFSGWGAATEAFDHFLWSAPSDLALALAQTPVAVWSPGEAQEAPCMLPPEAEEDLWAAGPGRPRQSLFFGLLRLTLWARSVAEAEPRPEVDAMGQATIPQAPPWVAQMAARQARRGDEQRNRQWLEVASSLPTRDEGGPQRNFGSRRRREALNANVAALGREFEKIGAWEMLGGLFAQAEARGSESLAEEEALWSALAQPCWAELLKSVPESSREAFLRPAMSLPRPGAGRSPDSMTGHCMRVKMRLLAAASQSWGSEMAVFGSWPREVVAPWVQWEEKIVAAATRKELVAATRLAATPKSEDLARTGAAEPAARSAKRL
jgi:hypothetical protein